MKMKRYCLLLTLLSFALVFEAKEVSYNEALQTASKFFAPASSSKKQVRSLKSNLSLATTFNQTEAEKPAFYIINNGEKGFVIVSADDNAKQILAYSEQGSFDAENIPTNVKFWLDRYAEEISYMVKNETPKPLYATPSYTAIEPLLGSIQHDQGVPYNGMCPVLSFNNSNYNGRAVTGCAATAAAQIMTKWNHPANGKGEVSYTFQYFERNIYTGEVIATHTQSVSADLSQSTYHWDKILDRYTYNNYTTEQGNAVAQLVKDVGYAATMQYNVGRFGGSGTSDQDIAAALVNNFDYDKSLHRSCFNASYSANGKSETMYWNLEADVIDEIYAELQAGRPIFFAGQDPKGGGHAFVCDGINAEGKLHINWGWGGSCDAYYELTGFNPGPGGIGSGDNGVYTADISFLTHIQKNKGTKTTPVELGLRNLSYTQTTNTFNKSDKTSRNLFKAVTTYGTNVVYAGYDYFNLGYTDITKMGFGYVLCKNNVRVYSSAAPWTLLDYNYDVEEDKQGVFKGLGLSATQLAGKGNDITPVSSISTLVNNVQTGVYDLHVAAKDHAVGVFYPVYVWNRGKVKNKIAVGKDNVYIYPASTNYSRSNKPTNLQATQSGSTYTLSWSGNASNYMLLIWDDDDLTVEKVSSTSKSGVAGGKSWAVFACETSNSVVYATSNIVYGDVLPAIIDDTEKTSVKVTKVWDDNDNQDGSRPSSVTVKLLANGTATGKTLTLSAINNWTSTFTDLDVKLSGNNINYTVDETSIPSGYTRSITGSANTGFTITNTHTPEKKSIKVTKVWSDNNDQDGLRPTSVTIKLLADGTATSKTLTLSASNSWTSTFTNLDVKANGKTITYTVTEDLVSGYTRSITGSANTGFTITNTHTPEKKSIKVTKVWSDNDNQDGSRPSSVTIKLLANGTATSKTLTLSASNSWTSTFTNLDAKASGNNINYTVDEASIPSGYTRSITGSATTGFTITNTHTPTPTPPPTPDQKNIKVTKVWSDNDDQDGVRPSSVTVKLLANGTATGKTLTLSGSNNWTNTFTNLDANITYSVQEDPVSGYTPSVAGTADAGFTITNTHTPKKKDILVQTVWDDNNNKYKLRPTSVTIKLLADGKGCGKELTVTESNNWAGKFTNVNVKAKGQAITYTVDASIPNYEVTVKNNATNTGFIITNKCTATNPTTDAENVDEDKAVISTHHLTIQVKAAAVSAIQIYNVSGDMLYSVRGTQASFKAPQAGVYVVQVGDKKRKVLVK